MLTSGLTRLCSYLNSYLLIFADGSWSDRQQHAFLRWSDGLWGPSEGVESQTGGISSWRQSVVCLLSGKNRVLERVPWSCLDCSKVCPISCIFVHEPGIGGDVAPCPLEAPHPSGVRCAMFQRVFESRYMQDSLPCLDPGCLVLLGIQAPIQRACLPMLGARKYLSPNYYQSIICSL